MTTTLTLAPISEAPVREGEEDLRPVRTENGRLPVGTVATGTTCRAAEYSSRPSTACYPP